MPSALRIQTLHSHRSVAASPVRRTTTAIVIKALLFDFDGLILDTEMPIYTAWRQVYEEFECSLTLAEYADCVGGTHAHFDPLAELGKRIGRTVSKEEIQPRVTRIYRDLIARNETLPGVRETLDAARATGLRTAVASNSNRDWVEEHLDRLGLLPAFEVIRTRDDVPLDRLKPAPDLYLTALDALGVAPNEAIAFEDSPHGILAARRAGIFAVAVPNTITRELPLNEPDLHLASLDEMPLPELLEAVQRARIGP